ncbi:winged helix-turn-helix domain-containing protein [Bacillus cabrialesii]|nr:helix-turn-helix domain-containing protein [Bacillus cabrialesii]AUZ27748.1 winged helix family transcriptional regulator [Bacillus cereus]OLQ49085.1 transcriptional regulator [Bacillus licheniformis]POO74212.1 winged helix family transcriptional regulator [Bacillus subtilis]MBU2661031.1 helix-turn-helix domain-containing protein [Bacillus cabrialesii]MDU0156690.1 helix-turn-helix domain-containing protein [Bacillus cabrialesii]
MLLIGDWLLDSEREMLVNEDSTIPLSRIQFRLLHCLAVNNGRPVSKAKLIKYAWGEEGFATKNALYVYINRLRQLIEKDVKRPRHILCLRREGYILYPKH